MTVPGRPPRFLGPLPEFITTKGGEYLFIPGLQGLRTIAAGITRGSELRRRHPQIGTVRQPV